MVRNLSVALLTAGAIALGALGLSSGVASACSNNNAGYTTCAPVYQDNNWQNDRMISIPVPYSNQAVWVPNFMWNFTWVEVRDEAGNFPYLDLRNWGPNRPPQGIIPCVWEFNPNFDYGAWRPGTFKVEGQIRGYNAYLG